METQKIPRHILPLIVFSQFAGTSLWFAGNAVIADLQQALQLGDYNALGDMTSAVQLGFIAGTFVFALLSIADRFAPTRVFLMSALVASLFNLGVFFLLDYGLTVVLLLRFLTGFFLAGIYPVGMKIAADWYAKGLGKALGYLVGALVLGTAFPHLIRAFSGDLPWQVVIVTTSLVAAIGGVLLFWLVPNGPHRKKGAQFEWNAITQIFKFPAFRSAAFGYFGHMWELYAFWAFVPQILALSQMTEPDHLSLWSFIVIAMGSIGCIIGGYWSLKRGSAAVAKWMLLTSGLMCLLSPFLFALPQILFLLALLIWGFAVVGDSPQFSTLVARTAPKQYVGTALTIVNSIGFGLTIFSIQLLTYLTEVIDPRYIFLFLLPGPIFGLLAKPSTKAE